MISIEIKYNPNDIFKLRQFISKKLYKSNMIITRVIQTFFSFVLIYMSVAYIYDKLILSFTLTVLLLIYILVWNFFLIQNFLFSRQHSDFYQSMQIIFEQDSFMLKSYCQKKSYSFQYRYCKIKAIYTENNSLFIMLDTPVEFILIPKEQLGLGDYDRLIDYLKLKVDNNFIYTL